MRERIIRTENLWDLKICEASKSARSSQIIFTKVKICEALTLRSFKIFTRIKFTGPKICKNFRKLYLRTKNLRASILWMNLPRLFELKIPKLVLTISTSIIVKTYQKPLYGTITVGLGFASSRQTPSLSKRSITLQVKRTLWPRPSKWSFQICVLLLYHFGRQTDAYTSRFYLSSNRTSFRKMRSNRTPFAHSQKCDPIGFHRRFLEENAHQSSTSSKNAHQSL